MPSIEYFPDQSRVEAATRDDDPLLMLVSFAGDKILLSHIDDSFEHVILLKNLGYSELEIDKYFRIVLNREGADWTFVCPPNYKNIANRDKRIEQFYNDGVIAITAALNAIGYNVDLDIPKRYRRHFDRLGE